MELTGEQEQFLDEMCQASFQCDIDEWVHALESIRSHRCVNPV